jgi:hypothetical protein
MNDYQKLHDRVTRGEVLTKEEHLALENWYEEQDQVEQQRLSVALSSVSVADLQAQTSAILKRLELTAQYIQETLTVNNSIRQDIAVLEEQLAHQRVA